MDGEENNRKSVVSRIWAELRGRGAARESGAAAAPGDLNVTGVWRRAWYALNELAAHVTIVVAIMIVMVGLETANHDLHPKLGLMVVDVPFFKLPLDWFFSLVDAGALSRLALAGFKIFRRL
jgi:hypothetical protein